LGVGVFGNGDLLDLFDGKSSSDVFVDDFDDLCLKGREASDDGG
jgi:hypothetical protein